MASRAFPAGAPSTRPRVQAAEGCGPIDWRQVKQFPGIRSMLLRASMMFALGLLAVPAAETDARAASYMNPSAWVIGPIIRGQSRSRGMPLHPSPGPGRGWHIDFPQAPGSVHYVTFRHGSLAGKSRIVMRYRVEAAPGVRIVP